ncbi:MAG: SpoIIE family protein phosphatase [Bacteroidales bacterium]|nr:SpoIIE family protein phosphatase [Bacteroidales bacterium]
MSGLRYMSRVALIVTCLAFFSDDIVTGQAGSGIQKEIKQNDEIAEKYLKEGNLAEAAKYFNKSAYLLRNHNQNEKAAGYYQRILEINNQLGNQKGSLVTYNNLGMIYLDLEQYDKALSYLQKGLEISNKIDTKEGIISSVSNVAVALQGLGRYQESNERLESAIQMAKDINNLKLLRRCYGITYENYDKLGQSDKSYQYFDLYSSLDKEIKRQEMKQVKEEAETEVHKAQSEKQLTETELRLKKAELEVTADSLVKAEKLTREQKLELDVKNAEIREKDALLRLKNLRIRFFTIGLIVLLTFLVLLTLLLIKLRIANRQIRSQRDMLDLQNKNITASIRYAMTIQQAMLPDENILNRLFESFIIYMPKDIVSGDFYWFSGFDEKIIKRNSLFIAVVDCTGHGVPGAFMSMIGNRLLNEIVSERQVHDPKEILELLNNEVRIALRQEQTDNNDGMDLLLCRFEIKKDNNLGITFSGAKRTLYILRNENKELICLHGERKSIGGIGEKKESLEFTNQELTLHQGDIIYMLTDGIVDQNGPDRKRFGSKKVEELITNLGDKPMDQQREIFTETLADFMGKEAQRDDITIIGLKVKKV